MLTYSRILFIFILPFLQGEILTSRYAVTEEVDEGNQTETKKPEGNNSGGYEIYEIVNETNPETNNFYDNIKWMIMPDSRGNIAVGILSGLEPRNNAKVEEIDFYLYSRQNPTRAEKRTLNNSCLPVFKYFKAPRPTKVLIHGFGDSAHASIMYPLLKDAFISRGDYNIILVDWNKIAAIPWYNYASSQTVSVARHTARLLDHLSKSTGMDMSTIHLIGFSLGAHVAGLIGQYVTQGRIKRITALDPASVLYGSTNKDGRLDPSDADLVEVIHTSGGYLGFQEALGHRDIFPNGGFWPQPGCVLDYAGVCSHRRAYYYYGEAVKQRRGFRAIPCNSWPEFMAGSCDKNYDHSFELASDSKSNRVKGRFFLKTKNESPFGITEKNQNGGNSDMYDFDFNIFFDKSE